MRAGPHPNGLSVTRPRKRLNSAFASMRPVHPSSPAVRTSSSPRTSTRTASGVTVKVRLPSPGSFPARVVSSVGRTDARGCSPEEGFTASRSGLGASASAGGGAAGAGAAGGGNCCTDTGSPFPNVGSGAPATGGAGGAGTGSVSGMGAGLPPSSDIDTTGSSWVIPEIFASAGGGRGGAGTGRASAARAFAIFSAMASEPAFTKCSRARPYSPGLREREAQVVVRLEVSGLQLDGGLELPDRAGQLVGLQVHEAQVDPQRRVGAGFSRTSTS